MSNKCRSKVLPPNAVRTLRDPKFEGALCVTVFVGRTACRKALTHARRPLLAVPYGKDPAIFDWQPFVSGRDVVLIEFGSNEPPLVARAAQSFLTAGAKLVSAVHGGAREISIFRQSWEPDHVA